MCASTCISIYHDLDLWTQYCTYGTKLSILKALKREWQRSISVSRGFIDEKMDCNIHFLVESLRFDSVFSLFQHLHWLAFPSHHARILPLFNL